MTNDWIIDVLMDLRLFAEQNGLATLADHLDDTVLVAASELAARDGTAKGGSLNHAHQLRGTYSTVAASDSA